MKQVKQFSGRPSYKVGMKKSFSISCRVPYLPSDPQRQTGTFALAEPGLVCYTAVFSFLQPRGWVSSRNLWGGSLRDETKNGS